MIDCTDEMCDVFIARGVVSHLIHLTQIEEPEEVSAHVFLPVCSLTQYICALYTCAQLSGKVHVSALSALRNLCLPGMYMWYLSLQLVWYKILCV